MKKGKMKLLAALVLILLAGLYYYVALPAINIHSEQRYQEEVDKLIRSGNVQCV